MNPCDSAPIATAPYYREARVTFVWRQTAYRMRHCCARRIDGTGSKRKLLRTSTKWAERHPQGVCRIRKAAKPPTAAQQRIIEAEANRIATATRLRRAMAVQSASIAALRAARLQCEFSLGGCKGGVSLFKKEIPLPYPRPHTRWEKTGTYCSKRNRAIFSIATEAFLMGNI